MKKTAMILTLAMLLTLFTPWTFSAETTEPLQLPSYAEVRESIPFEVSIVGIDTINAQLTQQASSASMMQQLETQGFTMQISVDQTKMGTMSVSPYQMTTIRYTVSEQKAETESGNPATMGQISATDTAVLQRQSFNYADTTFEAMEVDQVYGVDVTVQNGTEERYYTGWVEATYDIDQNLSIDQEFSDVTALYELSTYVENGGNPSFFNYPGVDAYIVEMVDSTFGNPASLSSGTTPNGAPLTSAIVWAAATETHDEDYYYFVAEKDGYAHISLLVPDDSDYDIMLHQRLEYSDGFVGYSTIAGSYSVGGGDEMIAFRVQQGGEYLIQIVTNYFSSYATQGYYTFRMSLFEGRAWFPSSLAWVTLSDNSRRYAWNIYKLDTTYFNIGGIWKSFLPNTTESNLFYGQSNASAYVMSSGCYLSCWAMILANLGTTYNDSSSPYATVDIRTTNLINDHRFFFSESVYGLYGNLYPDPYIVFLVNNNLTGFEFDTYTDLYEEYNLQTFYDHYKYNGTNTNLTVIANHSRIASGFRVNGQIIDYEDHPIVEGTIQNYNDFDTIIGPALENCPQGIMIGKTNDHMVVVTKELNSQNSYEYRVYDPYSGNASQRYGVELRTYMTSGVNRIAYNTINMYRVIDLAVNLASN